MKKLGKFIFGTLSIATVATGAYYLYKNYIKKDSSDDFDEFEDDFEDFNTDEETDKDSREYVSINITSDEDTSEAQPFAASAGDDISEEADEALDDIK